MDFLFMHFERLEFPVLAVVAILRCFRTTLLTIQSDVVLFSYLRNQQHIVARELTAMIVEMANKTPNKILAVIAHPSKPIYGHIIRIEEEDKIQQSIASSLGNPVFPLSKGM